VLKTTNFSNFRISSSRTKCHKTFSLNLEVLDSLVLPSTTIVEPTTYLYEGPLGNATVTVEVNLESDGLLHWEYDVSNVDYGVDTSPITPIGLFIVPLDIDTPAANITSNVGWEVYVGTIAGHDNAIGWFGGENDSGIPVGQAAEFTFTTGAEAPISGTHSEVSDSGYAGPSVSIMVCPVMDWEYQLALKGALLDYADKILMSVVQADLSNQAYENSPTFQAIQSTLADKNPLSESELERLDLLIKKPTESNATERSELMQRLKTDGLKFDGTNELNILKTILDQGKKKLNKDPRKNFLEAYSQAVKIAINGLQVIDNERYGQYTRARAGGATHDEAWTWSQGGDTAHRRYELERLYDLSK
jgi:hypothetical protein